MASIEDIKSLASKGGGFAQRNLFSVELPGDIMPELGTRDINYLCTAVTMPGRTIVTHERRTDMIRRQVPYGFNIDDVTLTFKVLNDNKIRGYWEKWHSLIVGGYDLKYFDQYARQIKIHQLKKGISLSAANKNIRVPSIAPEILNFLAPSLSGGITIGVNNGPGIRLGANLAQGDLSVEFISPEVKAYTCTLREAYPISISPIEYGDDNNEFVTFTVTLTYTDWYSEYSQPTSQVEGVIGGLITRQLSRLLS